MGGFGSGHHYRRSASQCCEDTLRLNVSDFTKKGCFKDNTQGYVTWSVNDVTQNKLAFFYHQDALHLTYTVKSSSALTEPRNVEQKIYVSRTPCHYGGLRTWFVCGCCKKRAAKLFLVHTHFYCRRCQKLPYKSQQMSKVDRLYARKHELGAKTFSFYEHGEGWGKPKGQHWTTFEKNKAKYDKAKQAIDRRLMLFLMKYNIDLDGFEAR